jgi:Glyoxalase/Bleomycin resistance protein/Dioxygenase superfamily
MTVKAGYSTPMLHVAEIEKSIRFYELLGFVLIDTDRCVPLGWARMHCDGGAIAFLRAEEEHRIDPSAQGVLLYMYTPDLIGLREQLLASGQKVRSIAYPEYMPSGELNLADPDGYHICFGHWGKSQQEAWEKRISGSE